MDVGVFDIVEEGRLATGHVEKTVLAFAARLQWSHEGAEIGESNIIDSETVSPGGDYSAGISQSIHIGRSVASRKTNDDCLFGCHVLQGHVCHVELHAGNSAVDDEEVRQSHIP